MCSVESDSHVVTLGESYTVTVFSVHIISVSQGEATYGDAYAILPYYIYSSMTLFFTRQH